MILTRRGRTEKSGADDRRVIARNVGDEKRARVAPGKCRREAPSLDARQTRAVGIQFGDGDTRGNTGIIQSFELIERHARHERFGETRCPAGYQEQRLHIGRQFLGELQQPLARAERARIGQGMGAFVNLNTGKRVRLGRYVAVLGDEQQALLILAEHIGCAEGHGACGLADGGRPHARALPCWARPQRRLGAAAPIDAHHAGLKQLQ